MPTDQQKPIEEAIALWSGIACPNAAGRRGLEDFRALIKDFEALRGTLVFEDEPSTFEAALRAEASK
jgi:hypothetical protein